MRESISPSFSLIYSEEMPWLAGSVQKVAFNLSPSESIVFAGLAPSSLRSSTVLLDTGHAHINNWNLTKVIAHLGPRLVGVHLHDNDGLTDQHLPVGVGTIEWQPVFAALKKWASQTRLVLEYADTDSQELTTHVPRLIKNFLD